MAVTGSGAYRAREGRRKVRVRPQRCMRAGKRGRDGMDGLRTVRPSSCVIIL